MRLTVFSHKACWPNAESPTGYATDGGFPFQMAALSELFDETRLVVPVSQPKSRAGESLLTGHNVRIVPLSRRAGEGLASKFSFIPWLLKNGGVATRELTAADAIHAPVPGDVGTVGMIGAYLLRKPLFVRHCGNWLKPKTTAEKFWRGFMERTSGGRNVMLATGGAVEAPSSKNAHVRWIFSSSLTTAQLSQYGIPRTQPRAGRLRLCLVARQDPAKGAGVVIRALPLLASAFPEVGFDIVGDGPGLPEFNKLAAELGVTQRVAFHGKLNHQAVMQKLREADVFCFPTAASDGFPKAVLEGMASGLPVVATKVSVLPVLLGGGCGVLLDERTPENLAAAIKQIVQDRNVYEAMSAKAVETAKRYSLEAWRDTIGEALSAAWGPLSHGKSNSGNRRQLVLDSAPI